MANSLNIKTSQKIVPMCYGYTTPQIKEHDGWTKIGFTERDVETRIKEQTKTADVQFRLEWKSTAIYDDGSGDTFTDKDFHAYLKKDGVENKQGTEWFHILPKDSHSKLIEFKANRGIFTTLGAIPYTLRGEQIQATSQTKEYFEKNLERKPECLWNAKPRFGKTLATYDLCKQLGAKTILIVTNRPAIANSWYDDYVKFLGTESGYFFISETEALRGKPYVISRDRLPYEATGYIEFVSLQDMKGSVYFGGRYDKLKAESQLKWDILVIDEAHEGVDTYKTDVAFDQIKRKYTLHLSGTPFKALANNKFEEKAIFNWTYADEQKAKKEWNNEAENPYSPLPKLNLYTYQMSEIVRDIVEKGADFRDDGEIEEYAFDLNEFFSTDASGNFKYEESVDAFLHALTAQEKFPFSTPELRNELKHTFWLLDRVDSAKALAKKLQAHPIFGEYEIVLCAGDGKIDDFSATEKSFNKVIRAIKEHDKTITLSVGQLTTGVTIPEWTAVLMLSNIESPSLYMQAAFRAQNPCLFNYGHEFFRKENAYVFDFDPARTLVIFEEFANDLSTNTVNGQGDTDTRKKNVKELINFFPVYGEDEEGKMVALDAEKVLSIPRVIHAREVVKRGFMSNFLFQNIGNIFSAPKEVINIITKFEPMAEPVPVNNSTKDELSIDANGQISIPEEQIIGLEKDVFGKKIYDVPKKAIENLNKQIEKTKNKSTEDIFQSLKEQLHSNVTDVLIQTAKENYGKELSKSSQASLERKINSDADVTLAKQFGTYKIEQNKADLEYKEALKQAKQDKRFSDLPKIEKQYNEKKEKITKKFKEDAAKTVEVVTKNATKSIIETIETDKKQKAKTLIEDNVRDHLRGFSRTIPSFLMAYGDDKTTLENFDLIIPNDVFQEVTSISIEEFKFLRDGGDYKDEQTGETKHYEGHLFDPIVFNDSVREFLSLKQRLSNYFDANSKEDIFDYIPPQKTNQIFTPKKVVRAMIETLEKDDSKCFENEDRTFMDLYMKSGLYIAEIVKRLFASNRLKKLYPNENERLKHIFEKQVFGLAPTEIIYRITISYVLGFDKNGSIKKHNLKRFDALPSAQNDTLERDLDKLFKD